MKKSIIALAVAGAIAAPAAMADATVYGTIAIDFINTDNGTGAKESQIQRDDTKFGIKGTSQTDGGLMVEGHMMTEGGFNTPTLAYIKVGTETTSLWAGRFANPAGAADATVFSDTDSYSTTGFMGNLGHFTDELDNAVGLTYAGNGLTAAVGAFDDAGTSDGVVAQLGYSAGGISANVAYEKIDNAWDVTGVRLDYKANGFGAGVYFITTDFVGGNDVDTTGVTASYNMGATTVTGILQQDDSAIAAFDADLMAVKVAHNLGGGLSAYAELSNTDYGSTDTDNVTIGMSYSF